MRSGRSISAYIASLLILLSGVHPATASAATAEAVVRVESGELSGEAAGGVVRFLGIPYAAPPVGDLRWEAPAPAPAWTGLRAAKAHGPACIQTITPDGFGPWTHEYVAPGPVSEDCLTLNIWAPAGHRGAPLPVMVWIHGGAFMSGSNSVPIYDGTELARQGIIVVSINYRVGALGFAAFEELSGQPGGGANFGLQDILSALRWTQRNVVAFGGDPARVTVAGQSAGAMAVHMLLLSPQAEGLFAGAIAQSGIVEVPLPGRAEGNLRGADLMTRAKLPDVASLRRLSVGQLMALLDAGPLAGAAKVGDMPLIGPIVDGAILPAQVAVLESADKRRPVPMIVGLNADEGVLNPGYFQSTPEIVREHATRVAGEENIEALLPGFRPGSEAAVHEANRHLTRLFGLASLIDWARAHRGPVFAYYFTHPEPGPGANMFGAFHSGEIPYIFNVLKASPERPFEPRDHEIADHMSRLWANFVRSGDPNGTGLPHWPKFADASDDVMELGKHFAPYRKHKAAIDRVLDRLPMGPGRSVFGIDSFAETSPAP